MHKYIKIYITQPKQGTPRKRNIKQGVPLPNTYTLSLRRCHSRSPARTTYIHIRQTTLTISSTTVKPNHPHEMPLFTLHNIYEYLLTIKTMQQKVLHSNEYYSPAKIFASGTSALGQEQYFYTI